MRPVQDVLNQIKWDESWNEEDFTIGYRDLDKITEIPYSSIEKIEGEFMVIIHEGQETNIPLHRIRVIKKKGEVIWQRSSAD